MNDIKVIRFENLHDIELPHVFECGQCFRWNECEDGSYIGVAGGHAAHVSLEHDGESCSLIIECTGGSEEYWHSYFDLDTDYGAMKKALLAGEPKLAKSIAVC
ncbi:MAG: 8-oxoguanine DNA glycosylase, N-terminal domain-containing protein, partial [Mogibacterium diversum]|nr:8-oxoguanine DNA glycosylase, N-terminal domain-containing protein [Mogibacterium diversum]